MRILVWGDSALAGWLTHQIHSQKNDVVWLSSSANPSFSIQQHSNTISADNLPLVKDLDAAIEPIPDVIIFAMPAWQVNDSAFQLAQKIPPKKLPNFINLASGIGSTEKLRNYFGEERVLRTVMTAQFKWEGDDKKSITIDGQLGITSSTHPLMSTLKSLLNEKIWGGTINQVDDLSLAWSDVFYNLHSNALAALMDVDAHQIYESPRLFAIEHKQVKEALRVIDAINVDLIELNRINVPRIAFLCKWLPPFLLKHYLKSLSRPSKLRAELKSGVGRSDAAYFNGAVAATGNDASVRTTVNHALALNVTDLAEGRNRWDQFRDNIEYLETIIRIIERH